MEDIKEEFNLDTKVTVRSIANWDVGFKRRDGYGDILISPCGRIRLSRNEIISQIQNGNRLFTGIDGNGSHATLYIEDELTRREVGFDSEDGKIKQEVFDDGVITKLFGLKTQSTFEKNVKEVIRTRAEKRAAIQAIKRLKLNDYSKIRFIEDYTGYKMQ
ncbi:MAG: hypothetical protein LUG91_00235 [Ruminococcus sp.]|nr:hypothetical protein [Ruminococcus sp.]